MAGLVMTLTMVIGSGKAGFIVQTRHWSRKLVVLPRKGFREYVIEASI